MDAREPWLTDRYTLLEEIGAGGMGVVYRARDEARARHVALKTFRASSAKELYRLKTEFRALAGVRHSNVVEMYDLVVTELGTCFYTMELIDGVVVSQYCWQGDHNSLLARGSELPLSPANSATVDRTASWPRLGQELRASVNIDRVRQILAQLASAVSAIHGAGVLHRDLKPDNMLVTRAGVLKLIDFGLVANREHGGSDATVENRILGSLAYMSPEQSVAAPLSPASDWYAVGVTLFELLTGQLPFDGSASDLIRSKRGGTAPRPSSLNPLVPEDLDELCVRLLATRPEDRATADDVASVVQQRRASTLPLGTSAFEDEGFTGREEEIAELQRAFVKSRAGRAVVIGVDGPSGIGKSTLVREAVRRLRTAHPNLAHIQGKCSAHEYVQFGALDVLVDSLCALWRSMPMETARLILPDEPALLPSIFPVLETVPAIAERLHEVSNLPEDGPQRREAAFLALSQTLSRLSEYRPLIVVLDDFQRADNESHAVLTGLLRGTSVPAMLLVLVYRDAPDLKLPSAVGEPTATLQIERLSRAQIREVCLNSGEPLSPTELEHVVSECEGHPLFALELARHVAIGGVGTQAPSLQGAIQARVRRLDLPAQRMVELLGLSTHALPPSVVARVLEMGTAESHGLLEELERKGLARAVEGRDGPRFEPYHDQSRAAFRGLLHDRGSGSLHRRLAEAWTAEESPPQLPIAEAWHAAGELALARSAYQRAAVGASTRMQYGLAADLYRIVIELLGEQAPREERAAVTRARAQTLSLDGRTAEAATLFAEAAELGAPDEYMQCKRDEAHCLLACGELERGEALYREVMIAAGSPLPTNIVSAGLEWLVSTIRLRFFKRRWPTDVPRLEQPLPDAFRVRWDGAWGFHFNDLILTAVLFFRSLRWAEREGHRKALALTLYTHSSLQAAFGPRHAKHARSLLTEASSLGLDGDAYVAAVRTMALGAHRYYAGRYEEALQLLQESAIWFRRSPGSAKEESAMELSRLWTLYYLGDLVGLREGRERYLRQAIARGDATARTFAIVGTAALALLSEDRSDECVANAREVLATHRPGEPFRFAHFFAMHSLVHALLFDEDFEEAEQILLSCWPLMRRAQMTQVVQVEIEARTLRASVRLGMYATRGGAERLRDAKRQIKRIARVPLGQAQVVSATLQGSLLLALRRPHQAAEMFLEAASLARPAKMRMFELAAMFARANVLGDHRLAADTLSEATALVPSRTAAFLRMLAPHPGAESDDAPTLLDEVRG